MFCQDWPVGKIGIETDCLGAPDVLGYRHSWRLFSYPPRLWCSGPTYTFVLSNWIAGHASADTKRDATERPTMDGIIFD